MSVPMHKQPVALSPALINLFKPMHHVINGKPAPVETLEALLNLK